MTSIDRNGIIAWLAASPPEFVLTEGIVLPIEERLP
jgi:hypothetical protein